MRRLEFLAVVGSALVGLAAPVVGQSPEKASQIAQPDAKSLCGVNPIGKHRGWNLWALYTDNALFRIAATRYDFMDMRSPIVHEVGPNYFLALDAVRRKVDAIEAEGFENYILREWPYQTANSV